MEESKKAKAGGRRAITIGTFVLAVFWLLTASAHSAQGVASITVEPRTIDIGALYDGITLTVTGSIPADSEAIVRFIGDTCDLHMKEKGKVGGIMWMNLDSITFKGAPNVCLVSSAVDLKRLEAEGSVSIRVLRLSGLEKSVEVEASGAGHKNFFEELLKLKEKEGLYREMFGNVSYENSSEGQKKFTADVPLPSRLTPGGYVVKLDAVKKGEVIARAEQPVKVNLVGFPAFLSALAYDHSALYGVFATIVALLAGLGIGLLFQSRGSH
jgi:uncharacterized protein (TIGR02186 family)